MAAGEKVYLKHGVDSKVYIETPTDLTTPDLTFNKVDNTGTVNTDGQVLLAAGDVFTAALDVGSLAATANRNITLNDTVTTTGDMELAADFDKSGGITGGTMWAKKALTSTAGSIDISASDDTIDLDADVTADVVLTLNNDTVAADDITLKAGQDVVIAATKMLTAEGDLTIEATTGEIMADFSIIDMPTSGETLLTLTQNANMDLEQDFLVNNRSNTDLFADSTGGSVTSDAAGEWKSIGAHASENITLSDISEVITTKALTTDNGDITIDSDGGDVVALDDIIAGGNIDIYSSDDTTYLGGDLVQAAGDVTLHNNTELNGGGDQRIEATTGNLTAMKDVDKTTFGDLTLGGDDGIYVAGNVTTVWGDLTFENAVTADGTDDQLFSAFGYKKDLRANSTITKTDSGDLTLMGGFDDGLFWYGNDIYLDDDVTVECGSLILGHAGWLADDDTKVIAGGKLEASVDITVYDKLNGEGNLYVVANDNITLHEDVTAAGDLLLKADNDGDGGNMTAMGDVVSTGGSIDIYSSDSTTYLGDDVIAEVDLTLHNNTKLNKSSWWNSDQRLDALTGTLTAKNDVTKTTSGDLTLAGEAGIKLAGDVTTSDGSLTFEDDVIANGTGNQTFTAGPFSGHQVLSRLKVYGSVTKQDGGDSGVDFDGGDLTLESGWKMDIDGDITVEDGALTAEADQHIIIGGSAVSKGDMLLRADKDGDAADHQGHPLYGGDVDVEGDLISTQGSIDVYSTDFTTYLGGAVYADVDVTLHNNTELDGSGTQRIEATTGTLTAKKDVDKTTDGDLELAGASGIVLGGDVETHDGHLTFENDVTANGTGGQKFDADGFGKRLYAWDTITKITEGDLKLDGGIWSGYEIDLDGDVTVTDGDLTLGHLFFRDDTTVAAGKTLSASDDVKAYGNLNGEGDLTVNAGDDAGDDVKVFGNLNGEGDLTVNAGDDVKLYGDVTAAGDLDIYASDSTIYLHGDTSAGGDLSLHANTEFEGWFDQYVDAGGTLTADGYLRKLNSLFFLKSDGSLYLHAVDDIILGDGHGDDYVQAADVSRFGSYGGGVSIISDTGSIYTDDGSGTLNVPIIGRSSYAMHKKHVWTTGVDLPYGDDSGKAAIVIISKEQDLTLGSGAELTAYGSYNPDMFDDRPGVDFLDHDIPADSKLGGDPIDVAIYLASYWDDGRTGGNVSVGSPIGSIADGGAMVVDALDSVSFGSDFVSSLINGKVGWLEACSRISTTLESAIGRLPYAENLLAFPGTGKYVLRGENPEAGSGAWVLGSVGTYTHVAYEAAADEEVEFPLGGCPALMAWLADELEIEAEDIQTYIANTFALSTDIEPCEMCARLKGASLILEDPEATNVAALVSVVNEFATTPAPPSEEQMASIATAFADHTDDGTYYAAAGQWIDALVDYVSILAFEMGYSPEEASGYANKYVAPVNETGEAAAIAYVQARLAALGG
jgi:hypothetical protein